MLQRLFVEGHRSEEEVDYFNGWPSIEPRQMLKLCLLQLSDVCLQAGASTLAESLDISCLERLDINNCRNTGPLLRRLSQALGMSNKNSLTVLVRTSSDKEEDYKASSELVNAAHKLKDLFISTRVGPLLDFEHLEGCGAALESLKIDLGDPEEFHPPEALVQLSAKCPNLRTLGLSLVDLDDEIRGLEKLQPLHLSTSTSLTLIQSLYADSLVRTYKSRL